MKSPYSFDYRKATQAVNFFARNDAMRKINKLKLMKLLFLADRLHLRMYGRPITNDTYWAMKHGPVPSSSKDIVDMSDFAEALEKNYASQFFLPEDDEHKIASIAETDEDVFSESELGVLHTVQEEFGALNQFQLVDLCHSLPEWSIYRTLLEEGRSRAEMAFDDLLRPGSDVDSSHLEASREALQYRRDLARIPG